jgi:hypothetical protein
VSSIVLTADTLLATTPTTGAIEYDGAALYGTTSSLQRGVVTADQLIIQQSTYTLTSQTAAQKLFGVITNGQVTLTAGTYAFDCFFSLSSMSATSGTFGFALGGAATFTQYWWADAQKGTATLATATATQTTYNTTANTALATASVNTVGYAKIGGVLVVTAGGTLIPQVSLGVAAAAVVGVGSYFRIRPIGSTTVTYVGNWS